ncbi:MAG TPA: sigma-54 dependent transcriptional regulator [Patescibacteria group bacterium]|nr:sigma-54 dependent transcriptional regulator [Patescibacteria group bacterium]
MAVPSILLVEDSPSLASLYEEYLRGEPWAVELAETGASALEKLRARPPQAVLLDIRLPDMDGLDILRIIVAERIPCSVVVMTAHGSINTAVDAMRNGAFDFIVKPFPPERLVVTLRNALEHQRLNRIIETFKDDLDRTQYCGFIGGSLPMQAVYRVIEQAARSRATVFITGESGTGKELCADAVHRRSPRANGPFVAINCGAIPKDLMESEIFGHVRGAFTGATSDRDGAASRADNGTLFLDEICEMDLALQTKLLRFIQTGSFQRVGGSRTEQVDVRFLCATNRDPMGEVEAGRFREDLFYRLHVIPLHLPPLRERDDDVVAIANRFLADFAAEEHKAFHSFSAEAEAVLRAYDWPGNIRQLQNVVRNVVVLNDGEVVEPSMLPPPLNRGIVAQAHRPGLAAGASAAQASPCAPGDPALSIRPLWQVEKDTIETAISLCDGNIPKAAALLGISPSTIYRKRVAWEGEIAQV